MRRNDEEKKESQHEHSKSKKKILESKNTGEESKAQSSTPIYTKQRQVIKNLF